MSLLLGARARCGAVVGAPRRVRQVRVTAASSDKSLFSLPHHPSSEHLTMEDVRDAYEVCSLIPNPTERCECYSVFGIDADAMSEYYDTVTKMERELAAAETMGAWNGSAAAQHAPAPDGQPAAITGAAPPPPAAAAALALGMLAMAARNLHLFL